MGKNKDKIEGVPQYAITEKQLRKLMKDEIAKCASELEWSQKIGVTPQSVSAFRRKVLGAGLKLPEKLGYRPQTIFLPLDKPLIQTPAAPRRPTDNPSSKVDHTKEPIEKNAKKVAKTPDKEPVAEKKGGKKKKKGKKS